MKFAVNYTDKRNNGRYVVDASSAEEAAVLFATRQSLPVPTQVEPGVWQASGVPSQSGMPGRLAGPFFSNNRFTVEAIEAIEADYSAMLAAIIESDPILKENLGMGNG